MFNRIPLITTHAQDLPPEVMHYADLIFYNGSVLTMDRDKAPFTVVRAVAVRDGRVLAVGDDDRILKMAGPQTTRVNLNGRAVLPGIVDTHSHPNTYGLSHYSKEYNAAYIRFLRESRVRFVDVNWASKETVLADFKKAAQGALPDEWIYTTVRSSAVQKALNRD
ncbi:MAG: hypothetical protein HYX74_06750, partial [Acidobacteria bacterium]|nr:hypothetical protein [Acidobacteriota bacterium]